MKLSIVIPVYNELATLKIAVQRVTALDLPKELVIVDDGSTDGSRELLTDLASVGLAAWLPDPLTSRGTNEVRVHLQPHNMGKGAALRTGFALTTGDIVVIQDADLEYDPQDIPHLIQPIVDGFADATFGSRFIGSPRRVLFFWHMVLNQALTLLSNMLNDLNVTDMETCYKAFRSEIIKAMIIEEDRFGIEPEIMAKLSHRNLRLYEVPVSYKGRTYAEGKKIGWKDGVRALYCILKYGLRRAK
ncbi:MAG TPA: glycosyltransferase family 2 protein [Polyangia bacterium]|nr:glycosyltransferase family 2 protein [Polyangia bacterium]